jgi:hypothetical protein
MRKTILTLWAIAILTVANSQNENQLVNLNRFIAANSGGTNEVISQFMEDTFQPLLLKKIELKEHIKINARRSKKNGRLKKSNREELN